MARIVYCHPSLTQYEYHVYTDLDFWDTRRVVRDLALVKRNFGNQPEGDEFPTQIVGNGLSRQTVAEIEKRVKKAIISPPRHVIVRSMIMDGFFEFDPLVFYPSRWTPDRMMRFTEKRLPMNQSSLCNKHQTVQLSWVDQRIRVDRVQRTEIENPTVRTVEEARKLFEVPSCF